MTVKDGRRFIDNGRYVTTAGVSAGIDGSLHLVARLLGRRVADQVARYMEYHWTPEPYLSVAYSYLNPSTSDRGRLEQSAEISEESKDLVGAAKIYRSILADGSTDTGVWFALAIVLRDLDDHAGAAEAFTKAGSGRALYAAAREYARLEETDRAVESLRKAWDAGFKDREAILKDPLLMKVRQDARFKSIVGPDTAAF